MRQEKSSTVTYILRVLTTSRSFEYERHITFYRFSVFQSNSEYIYCSYSYSDRIVNVAVWPSTNIM